MNVAVFGGTGRIGSLVVDELLARGDAVSALVRSPDKIPDHWDDGVRVVAGPLDGSAALDQVLGGADAVVSALGPVVEQKDPAEPLVAGTRAVVRAMERTGISRYVGLATPSVRDPRDRVTLRAAIPVLVVRTALPEAYAAVTGMTRVVMSSSLDWTIVRFLRLVDGPPTGVLRIGYVGSGVRSDVTRADVARFVVAQLTSDEWLHHLPQISN